MKSKIFINTALIVLFLLVFINNASAVGISPSRVIINFEPGLEQTITYTVYNYADNPVNVRTYVKGELENYTHISQTALTVQAQGTSSFFTKIKLPANLERPGIYDTRIGVVESAGEGQGAGTSVGAITGVEAQLYVQVPYPGKYASLSIEVEDVVLNKPINFKVNVNNLGAESINSAYAIIDISNQNDSKINSVNTETASINAKESGTLHAYWIPNNISIGVYKAVATLYYDGLTSIAEKQFKIGDLVLNLNRFNAAYDGASKFVKFEIELQSLWNQKIDDIRGKIAIKKDSVSIGSVNTESISMEPWATNVIIAYYPASDYAEGFYDAELDVKYANKSITGSVKFEIKNQKPSNYLIYGALFGLALIIFLLIGSIIALKKKNENK